MCWFNDPSHCHTFFKKGSLLLLCQFSSGAKLLKQKAVIITVFQYTCVVIVLQTFLMHCLCVCLYVAKEVQSCTPDVTDCAAASFCASVFTVKHRRARPTLTVINTQRCRDYRCWISPGLHQRISWHTCNDIRTTVSNKNHWPVGVIAVIFLISYTFLPRDAMHLRY